MIFKVQITFNPWIFCILIYEYYTATALTTLLLLLQHSIANLTTKKLKLDGVGPVDNRPSTN